MDIELKSCPFCGGVARFYGDGVDCVVMCDDCRTCSNYAKSFKEAAALWNKRTPCETCSEDKRLAIKVGCILQSSATE